MGYRNYPDDIVNLFVKKAIENGIDIIRVFDALNDIRNLEESVAAIKKYGANVKLLYPILLVSSYTWLLCWPNSKGRKTWSGFALY